MGDKNEPIPSQLQPGSSYDGPLQTSQAAPPFHHGASSSKPDPTQSFPQLDPSSQTCVLYPNSCSIFPRLVVSKKNNSIHLHLLFCVSSQNDIRASDGTKSTAMVYPRPLEPAQQQRVDYSVPFRDSSIPVHCPVCQRRTVSKTKNVSGGYTW